LNDVELIFKPMSGVQIDRIAERLVAKYQSEVLLGKAPFDIEDFVEFELENLAGINYDPSGILPPGIYGVTDCKERKLWISQDLVEDETSEKFFRSTLAHETGHSILHAPDLIRAGKQQVFEQRKGENKAQLYRRSNLPVYRNPEWQAYRFAGALLMPTKPFEKMVSEGATTHELSEIFNVNPAFVRARLKSLGLCQN